MQKLVAVTPVPASGVPFDDSTWALFSSAATSREAREGIIAFSTGNRLSKAWVAKMAMHSLEHATEQAFAAYLLAWAETDFASEVAGSKTPVQVIVGEYDPSLTADVMKATYLQCYPNARLEVVANAGHYPADETPVALATTIERFLDQP